MSAWLDPLRRALDAAPQPVSFFFRDDDVGWCDDRLFDLLHLFARHSLPVDLAIIPEALTRCLANELGTRVRVMPIEVHQHGLAHVNHEPAGRKGEFGPARPRSIQRRDIDQGRRRLQELLGSIVRPIFTPPWNRCTAVTGRCLVDLGFRVLSRDASAEALNVPGLFELPTRVDWFARRKAKRLSRGELGRRLATEVEAGDGIGIMFHHALMDAEEQRDADELLGVLAGHTRARCRPMLALVAEVSLDATCGATLT